MEGAESTQEGDLEEIKNYGFRLFTSCNASLRS